MSFAEMKKRRSSDFNKLKEKIQSQNKKSFVEDDRPYWRLSRDKSDVGNATIRFLPAPEGEEIPWAHYYHHSFQDPTTQKWYIERSLTSKDQADPLSELNGKLWNSGVEADKEQAKRQKRKEKYVSNILVISDKANPENEGKVFLFEYGKKIYDMIQSAMIPEFDDQDPLEVFDMWEGGNFKIRVRKADGWITYDKSEFDGPSVISEDEDEMERIYNSIHSLEEINDEKFYKSYDELQKKLNFVLGLNANASNKPVQEEAPAPQAEASAPVIEETESASSDEDDMDLDDFINSLGDED